MYSQNVYMGFIYKIVSLVETQWQRSRETGMASTKATYLFLFLSSLRQSFSALLSTSL